MRGRRSSTSPTTEMNAVATTTTSARRSAWRMASRAAAGRNTTMIPMPPRRGVGFTWALRSLGVSSQPVWRATERTTLTSSADITTTETRITAYVMALLARPVCHCSGGGRHLYRRTRPFPGKRTALNSARPAEGNHVKDIKSHIEDRSARIGVIGQGYVGLPLALVFNEAGFPVIGFDVDTAKVDALGRGESYIKHIGAERVATAVEDAAASPPRPTSTALPSATPSSSASPRRSGSTASRTTPTSTRRPREIARAAAQGPARRPRVHHLPRHDRRGGAGDPRTHAA